MKRIAEFIKKNNKFLVCMHTDPDGDTIGSSCALAMMLKKLKKKVKVYSSEPIPQKYRFIKHTDKISSFVGDNEKFDAVITLDCSAKKRVSCEHEIERLSGTIINIDHHSDNALFGHINLVKESSSTGELIYELAKMLKVKIDKNVGEAIYSAIITDTGNFKYDNTSRKVFLIAAELIKIGVSPYETALKIYETKSENEIKFLGKALSSIKFYQGRKVGLIALTNSMINKMHAKPDEMTQIVDYIRSVKDVEIAVLIRENKKGTVKINLRSKEKNVQLIAKSLGGGGHPKAAGILMNESISSAKEKILKEIKLLWAA